MRNQGRLYLFRDQTTDFVPGLRQLLRLKDSPLLLSFLEKAHIALRRELSQQTREIQELFPRFSRIVDLLSKYSTESDSAPILASTLTVIYQLGSFIDYYGDGSKQYPTSQSHIMLGLCTGQLAACTVASAANINELVKLAVEAVVIAFRTGLHVTRTRELLENGPDKNKEWAYIVPKLQVDLAASRIEQFSQSANLPVGSRPWIGTVTPTTVSIFGHPRVLKDFFSSPIMSDLKYFPATVYAPYHEGNIYTPSDIDDILRPISEAAAKTTAKLPVLSGATGKPIAAATYGELLSIALEEMLMMPLRLDRIIKSVGNFCQATLCPQWTVYYVGTNTSQILANRFDVNAHFDPTGKTKNASGVRNGCFINEPGLFDSRFFNLSPKEADQSDPAQRLALMTAYEALEMAGVVPDRTPSTQRDRVGIFMGLTSDDWREVNSGQNIGTYFIPGGNRAFTPGRINYHFKFSGPSVSVDTACSSSAAAIHMACNSLWRNDCDTALAGGTNVMTNPDNFTGLDKGHFLSHTGNCKTFDDGADGYCRADAVGTVVLKRLEDALADKDPIQAVICGAYTNHSAEAESITRPHTGAQSAIFRRILNDAGYDPLDVSYIEMHGTGTQAGDAVEMRSVLEVFTGARSGRTANKPLYLGSVKANIGHAESGSGVASLIKVMMMMKNNEIPPHVGIKTKINSGFPTDLNERGIRIAMEATPWKAPTDGKRVAFLNNFSAAGGNSALLLEESSTSLEAALQEDKRDVHLVTVSARTTKSLRQNAERLAEHLRQNPNTDLASLAYTTTARRMHYNYRLAVSGCTIAEVRTALEKAAAVEAKPVPRNTPGVAFAFTGQGSVYNGMGKHLFESFRVFREEIRRLDAIAKSFGFDTFLPLITGSSTPDDIMNHTPQATQLALTCFEIALTRLWESFGIVPSVVVGHSLGEYAAMHAAGVLSTRDTVFLVGSRARIMQERCSAGTHAMLAVKAPVDSLTQVLESYRLEVACINGPSQTVLAGLAADVDRAQEALAPSGIRTTRLKTDFAFHSSQVDPVIDEFKTVARGIVFKEPRIPILSPLLAEVVTEEGKFGTEYLARHCRETVDMVGAIQSAISQKMMSTDTVCLEIGPDPVVMGMLKVTISSSIKALATVRKNDSIWATMSEALSSLYQSGLEIQWNEFHRDFDASQKVISLPSYQWDYKNHWIQYVNNWCLTKGDAPAVVTKALPAPAAAPIFLSATCQKVLESEHGPEKSSVLIESDIAHPDLRAVFEAHKVNGAILCPSSVYADIAMTLGDYLHEGGNPMKKNRGVEVADMSTTKPLLMKTPGKSELFRVSAEADWASQTAQLVFYSVGSHGEKTIEHATCTVRFGDPDAWISEWNRTAYLVQSRMQNLRDATQSGQYHLIKRGLVYKLFENCVEYGEKFQGIEQVYLDSKSHEATARVAFKDESTCFYGNPYYIDSLGHLSGFIMNATESFDYKAQVFLNHGWESIRCAVKLSPENKYDTYVKMRSLDGKKFVGDVYIFHGDTVIGVNQGVAFQTVPRKVLDTLLPKAKAAGAKTAKDVTTISTERSSAAPKSVVRQPEISKKPVKEQAPVQPRQAKLSEPPVVMQAMNIIVEESGISMDELKNDTVFDDVGVDSLLSLAITGRFREELNIDVSSSVFMDYPTVGELKKLLGGSSGSVEASEDSCKSSIIESSSSSDSGSAVTEITDLDEDDHAEKSTGGNAEEVATINAIATVLSEEIGVTLEEVWKAPSLAELGLDSLLSLDIIGRLREDLNIDLPSDIFMDADMAAIKKALFGESSTPQTSDQVAVVPKPVVNSPPSVALPPATSVVLQGRLRTARKILFLFPDGSGSATSYAPLPIVAPDTAVVGLNCPYMRRPQDMKCGLQDLTAPYLAEIRRRQEHGPYYLGGWSAGGICAYDAAATLIGEGEQVASLVLIDSPNPINLQKLPVRMYDFLSSVGMFGSGSTKALPEWLLPHFLAFIDALALYEPKPMPKGMAPVTHAIWAAEGVYNSTGGKKLEPQPDDTREMMWLLNNRTNFGPNGWDQLVGTESLNIEVLEGANHFTMMDGPRGYRLSQFLAKSIGA
ncbi:polyketide synthetase protein [Rutstroemia sp. NJR-2017a WRK4]|nr:polyketide synthetase protein [Rutstroemia sp. NJR-2017a WRK4]